MFYNIWVFHNCQAICNREAQKFNSLNFLEIWASLRLQSLCLQIKNLYVIVHRVVNFYPFSNGHNAANDHRIAVISCTYCLILLWYWGLCSKETRRKTKKARQMKTNDLTLITFIRLHFQTSHYIYKSLHFDKLWVQK